MGINSSQQAADWGVTTEIVHQNVRRPTPSESLPANTVMERSSQIVYYRCVICKEHAERRLGLFCENHHFVCTVGGCFENYARAAGEPGASRRSLDHEGNLLCPACINAQVKYVITPAIESLIQLKVNVQTARALADQENKMRIEFTRIQNIEDGNLRRAEMLRMQIVEEVLNLRCPRCKTVFIDFSGCFHLTCSQNYCGCQFCAHCLRDYAGDYAGGYAPRHNQECPFSNGRNGTLQDFHAFHRSLCYHHHYSSSNHALTFRNNHFGRDRREMKVRELVWKESVAVQIHVTRLLQKDLSDLGIHLRPSGIGI